MILSCQNVSKSFGEKEVLKNITFTMNEDDKVAIIGANGAGKTTLFRILLKETSADAGDISFKHDIRIGSVSQMMDFSAENTVYEELLSAKQPIIDMENRIRSMEEEMKTASGADLEKLMDSYHKTLHVFDINGGNTYKSDVLGVLNGLRFGGSEMDKPVSLLSGGERTRLNLGKILLTGPDLLLLDEPTNYLDISSVEWLENYLSNVKSAVLLISHDRYFINKIANKTLEISSGKSLIYDGNYDDFIVKKEMMKSAMLAAYEKQQKDIKHQQEVIRTLRSFNREKSIKRADSRQRMLDKVELIEKPTEEKIDMRLTFPIHKESGNDVLFVDNIAKSYDGRTLFDDLSFSIRKGEHVALIGDNGTGKTNILKIINDVIVPDKGSVRLGTNVEIGYFDQQSAVLSDNKTIFDEISDTYPKLTNTEIRNVLAAFLFRGDEVDSLISTLSGGERGRVVLAKLMLSGANFLILDEPTNHLDMISKEILEDALNAYPGTLLYVSHDRYFINRTAERVLCLKNRTVYDYPGDYDYYVEKEAELTASGLLASSFESDGKTKQNATSGSQNAKTDPVNSALSSTDNNKTDWKKQKEEQAARRKLENQIKKIEEEISDLENALSDLEVLMNDSEIATNSVRLQEVCAEHSEKQALLDEKMAIWEELAALNS